MNFVRLTGKFIAELPSVFIPALLRILCKRRFHTYVPKALASVAPQLMHFLGEVQLAGVKLCPTAAIVSVSFSPQVIQERSREPSEEHVTGTTVVQSP